MKTNDIISNASLALNKIGFGLQKKSPEILVVAGVVGVVAAAVMACKATTKAGAIAETAKESIVEINEAAEKGVTKAGEEYTEEDKKKASDPNSELTDNNIVDVIFSFTKEAFMIYFCYIY